MAGLQKIYKDIGFDFNAHPVTGDLIRVYDGEAIKQSVKTLVMMNFYERPFRPTLGSRVTAFLFEPATIAIEDALKRNIRDVIAAHERRAEMTIIEVKYNEDHDSYDVALEFKILGLDNPIQVKFILNRVR